MKLTTVRRQLFRRLPWRVREPLVRHSPKPRPWDPRFDFTPPPVPVDCSIGAPDFIGVGAQKAGTSWWFDLITEHPDVFRPSTTPKELHYFDRHWSGDFSSADAGTYRGWFPRPEGTLTGEWTPQYLCQHWTPRIMKFAAPEARILVMLRDPVERYRSGITHARRSLGAETRAFGSRWRTIDPRVVTDAFVRGLYADQLTRLFRHFDPGQVLVLQYERCRDHPHEEIRRTYLHLGLDPTFKPTTTREVNVTKGEKPALTDDQRSALVVDYSDDVARLRALLPDLDLRLWPNFSHLL